MVRFLGVGRVDRDAQADADAGALAVQHEGVVGRAHQATGQAQGAIRLVQADLDHRELVAAEARERILAAQGVLDPAGQGLQ